MRSIKPQEKKLQSKSVGDNKTHKELQAKWLNDNKHTEFTKKNQNKQDKSVNTLIQIPINKDMVSSADQFSTFLTGRIQLSIVGFADSKLRREVLETKFYNIKQLQCALGTEDMDYLTVCWNYHRIQLLTDTF